LLPPGGHARAVNPSRLKLDSIKRTGIGDPLQRYSRG
jgi:hypothetical protein